MSYTTYNTGEILLLDLLLRVALHKCADDPQPTPSSVGTKSGRSVSVPPEGVYEIMLPNIPLALGHTHPAKLNTVDGHHHLWKLLDQRSGANVQ